MLAAFCCTSFYSPYINSQDMSEAIRQVKHADIEFSDYSKANGMKSAFLEFVHPNGVLLRPFTMPIVGYDAIKKVLDEGSTDITLTWAPLYGDVSQSGELGYTYGTYELGFKNDKGEQEIRKGTYVSIWKKDENGKWKWVLDTGNPGLEPKKE